jgi:hypothetical protein
MYKENIAAKESGGRIVKDQSSPLTFEIELKEGEKLHLPDALVASVGPGRWLVSIQPYEIRNHQAFLNSYSPEDEGLYDAYSRR